jgi:hypothetical protein
MGRTVTPFSIVLSEEQNRLKNFRRALRAEDQRRFDELFEFARLNVQAAVQGAAPDPMESLILLMLVEMLKRIETLEARLAGSDGEEQPSLFGLHEDQKD